MIRLPRARDSPEKLWVVWMLIHGVAPSYTVVITMCKPNPSLQSSTASEVCDRRPMPGLAGLARMRHNMKYRVVSVPTGGQTVRPPPVPDLDGEGVIAIQQLVMALADRSELDLETSVPPVVGRKSPMPDGDSASASLRVHKWRRL